MNHATVPMLWVTEVLGCLALLLLATSAHLHRLADRRQARRRRLEARWEAALPAWLAGEGGLPEFARDLGEAELAFLVEFLWVRDHGTHTGRMAALLEDLGLEEGIFAGLRSRSHHKRARAAMAAGLFPGGKALPSLVPLLQDPHPWVAFAAAAALGRSGGLSHGEALADWVCSQKTYQPLKLLQAVERLGPGFLSVLERHLSARAEPGPGWLIYAGLVQVHPCPDAMPSLCRLLVHPDSSHRTAALAGIAALDAREGGLWALAMARDLEPEVRQLAARILGASGPLTALPALLALIGDPSFEVRRAASRGLASLGPQGVETLERCAGAGGCSRQARDMAWEALGWLERERAA